MTARRPAIKRIGGGRKTGFTLVPFELVAYRDDTEVPLQFQARVRDGGGVELLTLMRAMNSDDDGAGEISEVMRLLTKVMDNSDGTKDGWRLAELDPADVPEPEAGAKVPSFRGPDGAIYPLTDGDAIKRFADPANGSSRKRWKTAMYDDDELFVYAEDVMAVAKLVLEHGAGRPTPPQR